MANDLTIDNFYEKKNKTGKRTNKNADHKMKKKKQQQANRNIFAIDKVLILHIYRNFL